MVELHQEGSANTACSAALFDKIIGKLFAFYLGVLTELEKWGSTGSAKPKGREISSDFT